MRGNDQLNIQPLCLCTLSMWPLFVMYEYQVIYTATTLFYLLLPFCLIKGPICPIGPWLGGPAPRQHVADLSIHERSRS